MQSFVDKSQGIGGDDSKDPEEDLIDEVVHLIQDGEAIDLPVLFKATSKAQEENQKTWDDVELMVKERSDKKQLSNQMVKGGD